MKTILARVILVFVVLLIAAIVLIQGGVAGDDYFNGKNSLSDTQSLEGDQSPFAQATMSAKATATNGAEQFYLQLTAIAGESH